MNKNVDVDEYGLNKKIQGHILPDDKMRKLGFTDRNPDNWYYCKGIAEDISFNVTIPKDGSRIRIDVLDEMLLQPYDYQRMSNKFAYFIKEQVEKQMNYLQKAGVVSGHKYGEYI